MVNQSINQSISLLFIYYFLSETEVYVKSAQQGRVVRSRVKVTQS